MSFFESYFSNYIEGTEFEIEEAEQIVFERHEINNRHQDSHDVSAVFDVVQDYTEMVTVPNSADELLDLLIQRHSLIMNAHLHQIPVDGWGASYFANKYYIGRLFIRTHK